MKIGSYAIINKPLGFHKQFHLDNKRIKLALSKIKQAEVLHHEHAVVNDDSTADKLSKHQLPQWLSMFISMIITVSSSNPIARDILALSIAITARTNYFIIVHYGNSNYSYLFLPNESTDYMVTGKMQEIISKFAN